jgi:hypothetical protein
MNEQLLAELEKRDQAIEEAMNIIAALEVKVERMEAERNAVRSIEADLESRYKRNSYIAGTMLESSSSLDLKHETASETGPRTLPRMPSFLSDQSEGAEALRSLYLPEGRSRNNLLTVPSVLSEEIGESERHEEPDGTNSPRLSVLSESSFLSVYGEKNLALEGLDLDVGSANMERGHRKSSSIEKWVDDRVKATHLTPKRAPSPKAANAAKLRQGQFNSILDVLESPQSPHQVLERTLKKNKDRLGPGYVPKGTISQEIESATLKQRGAAREVLRRTEMTSFGHQHALPPTPDTISTNTLRRLKTSNETLRSNSERDDDSPPREKLGLFYRPTSIRPHSAGETVTSRREGHGWDTVTQSEVTEANSDEAPNPSLFDPWVAMSREKSRSRINPTPAMFTYDDEDDERWGKDMMFNRDDGERAFPSILHRNEHSASRTYEPSSDTTIRRSTSTYAPDSRKNSLRNTVPFHHQYGSSPDPPQRKSSLAASPTYERRSRKPQPLSSHPVTTPEIRRSSAAAPAPATISAGTATGTNLKPRSRLSARLFGLPSSSSRGEPFPDPVASSTAPPTATATTASTTKPSIDFGAHKAYNAYSAYNHYASGPRAARRNNSLDSRTAAAAAATATTLSSERLGLGMGLRARGERERDGATPPPIARFPRDREATGIGGGRGGSAGGSGKGGLTMTIATGERTSTLRTLRHEPLSRDRDRDRPVSASSLESRLPTRRRRHVTYGASNVFGLDGAGDERDVYRDGEEVSVGVWADGKAGGRGGRGMKGRSLSLKGDGVAGGGRGILGWIGIGRNRQAVH